MSHQEPAANRPHQPLPRQQHTPSQSQSRQSLRAVIFDVDGTLAETERKGHRVAFNRAFEEFQLGWHWSPELYGELLTVTGGKERLRLYVDRYACDCLARPDFDDWLASLHQRKTAIYAELALAGNIVLRPGVARLIGELRAANIRLAIATTTTRACIDSLIQANFGCATTDIFAVVGAGDEVASKKPAPDIYDWVVDQLGLPAGDCLAIEDSTQGVGAACAAGVPTIVTVNAYTADDDFAGALAVVSSLGDVDDPARHIAGLPFNCAFNSAPDGALVDLAQLRHWHQHATDHH